MRENMKKISLNLTPRHRLDLSLVRERSEVSEPLVPTIDELRGFRRGNLISRFFRHIFEHKKIKRVLGSNLALMLIVTSFLPASVEAGLASTNAQTEAVISVKEPPLATEKAVQLPIKNLKINQGYHFFHPGIDFDGEIGDPVQPVMAGQVVEVNFSKFAYGNSVIISHGGNLTSLYAHLSKIEVKVGEAVTKESLIGKVGSTGWSTGAHLHLEVFENGRNINPLSILPKK